MSYQPSCRIRPTVQGLRLRPAGGRHFGRTLIISRRRLLEGAGVGAVVAGAGIGLDAFKAAAAPLDLPKALPAGTREEAVLEALPGKKPLIKLTYRPPNYETPGSIFRTAITPNDAFFVRYHLAEHPGIDAATWRLAVGGDGARRAELSLDDLKRAAGEPRSSPSANARATGAACSSRMSPGVQWGYGAMGNARWRGVRLKDVLAKAGAHEGGDRSRVRRRRRAAARQDAGFRQEPAAVEGDGREHPHRLRDERPAAAALQRLPGAHHRARLDRHLLDEAAHLDPRGHQAVRRLLDEDRPIGFRTASSRSWHASRPRRPTSTRRSPKSWSTR